jgi:hypothetical protein
MTIILELSMFASLHSQKISPLIKQIKRAGYFKQKQKIPKQQQTETTFSVLAA